MKLIAGRSNLKLCEEISHYVDCPLVSTTIKNFSDGELSVSIDENVRGEQCFVIQSLISNDSIMELFILLDTLKRASAGLITAVIPYYGYARQDRKPRSRTPISAKLIAELLQAAGAHRVITMDLHAGQIQGFFDVPVDDLYARKTFIEHIRSKHLENICVVSPDAGGAPRARSIAKHIDASLAIIDKRREKANMSEVIHIIGDVKDKNCIIVDDIADTCGTLANAAKTLKDNGAISVQAYITHGVLSGEAFQRINNSSLDELCITNTIDHSAQNYREVFEKINIICVADVFGEAIRRVNNNESVSSLFD